MVLVPKDHWRRRKSGGFKIRSIKKDFCLKKVISTFIPSVDEHKEEFTALIRELKNSFRPDGYQLSVTINPNVNNSLYLDVPATVHNFDWINLAAFDVQTPERNKKEVDFPAVSLKKKF